MNKHFAFASVFAAALTSGLSVADDRLPAPDRPVPLLDAPGPGYRRLKALVSPDHPPAAGIPFSIGAPRKIVVPSPPPAPRDADLPIDKRKKLFPNSAMRRHLDFSKVAYFRLGREHELDVKNLQKENPELKDEQLFGITLAATRRKVEDQERELLMSAVREADHNNACVTARRAWAGGKKAHLVAFSSQDTPLFAVDLQTTTATQLAFWQVSPVKQDLVRFDFGDEYLRAFYYEIDDARIGAVLFAIALDLSAK